MKGGKITASDALKWADDNGINPITLYTIVYDLKNKGEIICSREEENIPGCSIPLSIPKEILLKNVVVKSKVEKKRQRKKKLRTKGKTEKGLLVFLGKKEEVKKKESPVEKIYKKETREEKSLSPIEIVVEEKRPQKEIVEKPSRLEIREEKPAIEKIEDGEDLAKAIEYLNYFWSVGEIRFILDLKREGVKDPEKVLRRLLELGYVTRSPLGVINATERLPKLENRKSIADILPS